MTEWHEAEPYCQADIPLGDIELEGAGYPLRMRLHRSWERYHERRELVPLEDPSGERFYLHAKPELLVPDVRITIDVEAGPREVASNGNGAAAPAGWAIREVAAVEQLGQRVREVGTA